MATPNREEIEAFAKKHKVALIVGAVVIALMMMSEGGGGSYTAENGPGPAPVYDGGGGGGTDSGGGFDMDRWREEQRRDDRAQRDRIDSIREVESCYDPETGTTVEVSIHVGC
jgi:hypothetical protein